MARGFRNKKAEVEPVVEEAPVKIEAPVEEVVKEAPKAPKAISVDDMVEENVAAVVCSDYQKYLRKLMKEAQGKF